MNELRHVKNAYLESGEKRIFRPIFDIKHFFQHFASRIQLCKNVLSDTEYYTIT